MISEHDYIITAFAEGASGPGWANQPIWVIIKNRMTGIIREECIQPDDQSAEMQILYKASTVLHREMTEAVRRNWK